MGHTALIYPAPSDFPLSIRTRFTVKFTHSIFCPLLLAASVAHAQTPLSLVVDGNITNVNEPAQHAYRFDEAQLLALPSATITTATNWTPKQSFAGPKLSAVLAKVGAKGKQLSVCAIDDYCRTSPSPMSTSTA